MSEKHDRMKKVRIYPSTYAKMRRLQKKQPDKPSLSAWTNILIELGMVGLPKVK